MTFNFSSVVFLPIAVSQIILRTPFVLLFLPIEKIDIDKNTSKETKRRRASYQDNIFKNSKKIIKLPQNEKKIKDNKIDALQ